MSYSETNLSRSNIQARLDELEAEINDVKLKRQQQEIKIENIENLALRQRFQDKLEMLLQEQYEKEQEIKTSALVFVRRKLRDQLRQQINVNVDNQIIPDSARNLGLSLDSVLCFKPHVNYCISFFPGSTTAMLCMVPVLTKKMLGKYE
nr:unnamed protein product [Callosobruchus analis]